MKGLNLVVFCAISLGAWILLFAKMYEGSLQCFLAAGIILIIINNRQ